MALITCRECGRPVSTQAKVCPSCGAPIKKSKKLFTGCGCLVILLAGVICIGLFASLPPRPAATLEEKAVQDKREASAQTILYEILKKANRKADGKLIMDCLVDEAAPKADVLKLAASLQGQYAGKYASISIYDSREAWRRRLDKSYPEKELARHDLVLIEDEQAMFGTRTKDHQEIRWVAVGRDH